MKGMKKAREAKGMTQKQVADAVGISTAAVGNYEAGRREPESIALLCAIADFLECSVDFLIRGKEKDRPFGRSKEDLMKMFNEMSEEELLWMLALLQAALADKRFQAHLRHTGQV